VRLCVAFVSGQVRQPRLGIGQATISTPSEHHCAAVSTLTLQDVDDTLERVAAARGTGSSKLKQQQLGRLFSLATADERKFLSELLRGELRQGALEGVLMDAVSLASGISATMLRHAQLLRGDIVEVAATALIEGAPGLSAFRLLLFQPLAPMLALPGENAEQALSAGPVQAEFKLDGARIQVHKQGDEVRVFSRQLNDVTVAVPEIVRTVAALGVDTVILDGEALAMRPDGKPFAFQDTMRRFGRKSATPLELQQQLPLFCYFFDCLHVNGVDVFAQSYRQRQQALDAVTMIHRVHREPVTTPHDVHALFAQALSAGHEGLVLKNLDSSYEPGRRGTTWLKLKPVHTLDLVILAAEWGSGRRKGTLSNLHLGARSDSGFVMLGKTFKGLTDALLAFQTRELLQLETHRDNYTVYVRPELVVEIAFDGVQRSSQYPGGVALRFARVKRYRPDKSAAEADTIEQVLALVAN
jgi:DNA ligase 1